MWYAFAERTEKGVWKAPNRPARILYLVVHVLRRARVCVCFDAAHEDVTEKGRNGLTLVSCGLCRSDDAQL
jgi:hypothetical protein